MTESGCGDPSCRDPNCTYGREAGPGAPVCVAWRYQRKEGWGDIWRVVDIEPKFETPVDWTVEALGVIGRVEPVSNGGVVRHDIEFGEGPLDTRGSRLLDTRGFAEDEPLIFDLGEGVRRATEPKAK